MNAHSSSPKYNNKNNSNNNNNNNNQLLSVDVVSGNWLLVSAVSCIDLRSGSIYDAMDNNDTIYVRWDLLFTG